VDASPLTRWLEAIDRLDADAAVSGLAPDARVLAADGDQAQGAREAGGLMAAFLSRLASVSHQITAQWHVDDVWIAEVEATYELTDHYQTGPLLRVVIVRAGPQGITELRVYGAHERPLTEHRSGEEGMWVGGRWVPPL
jgi:SnoaL-like protein